MNSLQLFFVFKYYLKCLIYVACICIFVSRQRAVLFFTLLLNNYFVELPWMALHPLMHVFMILFFFWFFLGGLPVLSMTLVRGIQSDVGDFYYVC